MVVAVRGCMRSLVLIEDNEWDGDGRFTSHFGQQAFPRSHTARVELPITIKRDIMSLWKRSKVRGKYIFTLIYYIIACCEVRSKKYSVQCSQLTMDFRHYILDFDHCNHENHSLNVILPTGGSSKASAPAKVGSPS